MTNSSMNPNKALWEKGDFTRIANTMRESGEALVTKIGVTKGLKVLDLGCGDGTTRWCTAAVTVHRLGPRIPAVSPRPDAVERFVAGTAIRRVEGTRPPDARCPVAMGVSASAS